MTDRPPGTGPAGRAPILVVDDDPDDIFLVTQAFATTAPHLTILPMRDPEETQRYLDGLPPYDDRSLHPLPALILLDVKMPKIDGFDILQWMRDDPRFNEIPVFMFSSSTEPNDVDRAYALGANGYLGKVADMATLDEITAGIATFLETVTGGTQPPSLPAGTVSVDRCDHVGADEG